MGDKVIVSRFGNEDWIKELKMKDEIANNRAWKFDINYDREIIVSTVTLLQLMLQITAVDKLGVEANY